MMIQIKVCGMRNRENIMQIASIQPDFMGFIFYNKSKRYVGDSPDIRIFQSVPSDIRKVGVFVNESPDVIIELAYKYDLYAVQLHGAESPEECGVLRSKGFKVIKSFGIGDNFDFNTLENYISVSNYFLFDTQSDLHGGTGVKFKWEVLKDYHHPVPFILSGGIAPEDAHRISRLEHNALCGIDINSRFETEPGFKDAEAVSRFIHIIRAANINRFYNDSIIQPYRKN